MSPLSLAARTALLALLATSLVHAEEPAAAARPGQWGYWVVASSLVAGGGLTTYGLTVDCVKGDDPCRWRTGLTIWGGIGVASLGSMIGLAIVEHGERSVRVGATATASGTPVLVATGEF